MADGHLFAVSSRGKEVETERGTEGHGEISLPLLKRLYSYLVRALPL